MIRSKLFFEKNVVLTPNWPKMPTKWAQMGVYKVNFGVLRVPDPLGVEIMQKKFGKNFGLFWPKRTEKNFGPGPKKNRPKWNEMGLVGFCGPFFLLFSVGPNVYILSFWRYQNHLEPNEK